MHQKVLCIKSQLLISTSKYGNNSYQIYLQHETTKIPRKNKWSNHSHDNETKDTDSWDSGNKSDEPYHCSSLMPWKSFQATAQGKETMQILMHSLSWKDAIQNLGMPRWLEFTGQKERFIGEDSADLQPPPSLIFSWVLLICGYVWDNYPMQRKELKKRIKEISPRHLHRSGT